MRSIFAQIRAELGQFTTLLPAEDRREHQPTEQADAFSLARARDPIVAEPPIDNRIDPAKRNDVPGWLKALTRAVALCVDEFGRIDRRDVTRMKELDAAREELAEIRSELNELQFELHALLLELQGDSGASPPRSGLFERVIQLEAENQHLGRLVLALAALVLPSLGASMFATVAVCALWFQL